MSALGRIATVNSKCGNQDNGYFKLTPAYRLMKLDLAGKGQYDKCYFKYIPEDDEYECPAGERLIWRQRTEERGLELDRYWYTGCAECPLKQSCTTGPERRITRWAHEELVEEMQDRLDSDPAYMRVRRQTVEHPFGTIKSWMGATHFLMKGLTNVNTEMSLQTFAYNIKRVMTIMGPQALIAALDG